MKNRIDISGQKFGRLTAISMMNVPYWLCKCDCGNVAIVNIGKLKSGHTKSCGCLHRDTLIKRNFTHGMSETRFFKIWQNMKRRCTNPKRKDYPYYGGRGIKVCTEWMGSFESFYNDMYPSYAENLTLDRKDTNKDYCKDNCRWSTWEEQSNNKSNNIRFVLNGENLTLKQICNQLKLKSYKRACLLVSRGAEINDIIEKLKT